MPCSAVAPLPIARASKCSSADCHRGPLCANQVVADPSRAEAINAHDRCGSIGLFASQLMNSCMPACRPAGRSHPEPPPSTGPHCCSIVYLVAPHEIGHAIYSLDNLREVRSC